MDQKFLKAGLKDRNGLHNCMNLISLGNKCKNRDGTRINMDRLLLKLKSQDRHQQVSTNQRIKLSTGILNTKGITSFKIVIRL